MQSRLAALVMTIALGACSMPSSVLAPPALRDSSAAAKAAVLYVANESGVNVYAPGATVPKLIIPAIPGADPIGLASGPNNDLYVLSVGRARKSIAVYAHGTHLQYTIPQSVKPIALAIGPG